MKWQGYLTSIIAVGTILLGIWEFSDDSQRRADNAKFEARKPFLIKQMEMCFLASETTAILATTTNLEKWQKAKENFWVLYWGPLSIVESSFGVKVGPVEKQMVVFGGLLEQLKAAPVLPIEPLQDPSLDLAHKCRDLILDSWQIRRN